MKCQGLFCGSNNNNKKKFKMSSTEIFTQHAEVTTLKANLADDKLVIFFFQKVGSLHEMSKPIF